MDLGPHRATKGPTLQGRPPYDAIAGRAQSDEPLDGAAVTSATSSQRSHSKEARPADNQTTAVAATPSRGRPTTAGRRNANELDIELNSPSLGDQTTRDTVTRPIPPTAPSVVSASREPQAKQNERVTTPGSISSSASMKLHTQSHPAAIPSSSGIALPTRVPQEADSKTSRRPPQVEELEKRNQSPAPQTGFAREKGASRPSAEQVDRTASVQPSAKPFAHPSPSLNRPGVSTFPSSSPAAQTLIKTASNRMQVVRGTLRDEPQARSGPALSAEMGTQGHMTTAMTPPHNSPIAFRSVNPSSGEFSQIIQSGGMLKQPNATNSTLRPTIPSHNLTSSPSAPETSRSSSRSSRMDIQTKPGDKTTTTHSHPLQTPQPLATPTQQPTETRTQTPPLGRNGRRTDGGAPGPPGDEPPGPPGDGPPGSHRDGTPGTPRQHRPAATPTPREALSEKYEGSTSGMRTQEEEKSSLAKVRENESKSGSERENAKGMRDEGGREKDLTTKEDDRGRKGVEKEVGNRGKSLERLSSTEATRKQEHTVTPAAPIDPYDVLEQTPCRPDKTGSDTFKEAGDESNCSDNHDYVLQRPIFPRRVQANKMARMLSIVVADIDVKLSLFGSREVGSRSAQASKHNQSMDLGPHRATRGPTLQGRPPHDTIAGRAQSDEPLDGAAVTGATSSQQSHSKEARPTDNQTTAVTVAPPRGRPTTAGRRNANELGIEPDSRSLGDQQPAVGVDIPRHTVTRPIPPTGPSGVSASRGPQATQNERITNPGSISSSVSTKLHTQSHPAAIPSSSGVAPPTRASQEADSKTSRRPPQVEEPEKRNQSPAPLTGFAREKSASRPSAEQVDRTASVQPSAKPFAHPSPSLNRPGVSTSPSSYPAAQTLIKTASNRMQVVRGTPRDEPQARSGTALSELVPTPDEDKRKVPPYEQGPKNPIKLPQPSEHASSSTEPLSRHQPVPKPGHLDRSHSRMQGNEGGDREDKRAKGGTNSQKERQLPVVPDERRAHLEDTTKASGNTPHVRSELTSTSAKASGIAPSPIPPPVSSVERPNTSGRYGPGTARLPDTSGSQGKVGRSVDPQPSLTTQETAHAPPPTSAGTKDASGPSAEQVNRTASVQSSFKPFAHLSPPLNRPGVSTSPSSYPAAQTLIKTASNRMQAVRGTLRDEPQARSGTALSELVPTPDEDKRKAPPHEQGPDNPLGTPTKLPQPLGHAPSSTEPLSRHQPVPKPGHLDRSLSRMQGNEGGDREDKRAKGGANPQKERQLSVTPDERGTHLGDTVKASGNASHVRSEPSTSASASGIAKTPPVSSVERLNSSSRYGPSTARLPDTSGSQGKVGRSVDSEPSFGKKQETAHAPPPTSAGPHSTEDQPKPVDRAPADSSSTVSGVGHRRRRPSILGDTDIPSMPPPPHHQSSGMSAPNISPEARAKRETDPVPTVISEPKSGATGGSEPIPEPLVEFLRDVIHSPDGYKGIVSNEKRPTVASGELKGFLPSSGHTKTTAMTSPQNNSQSATAFYSVQPSDGQFAQISQSGGTLKQPNATNPKFRSGIALHNSALSPPAAETTRSSSRSSRMDIPPKPSDKTTTTQPHPLQTPQPLATPNQQPTETRTQTPPLGRNGMPADGGAPGPPGGGPQGPPGDDGGSHRDGTPGPPRGRRPAATSAPAEAPRRAARAESQRQPEHDTPFRSNVLSSVVGTVQW
ncbi:hypothetical protein BC826DRAFT_971219 [Russula brevipes]|nr:hypothetical protein BC826DRAFT_971219 [Russula brevipes]